MRNRLRALSNRENASLFLIQGKNRCIEANIFGIFQKGQNKGFQALKVRFFGFFPESGSKNQFYGSGVRAIDSPPRKT